MIHVHQGIIGSRPLSSEYN